MKPLATETNHATKRAFAGAGAATSYPERTRGGYPVTADGCAGLLLETVPLVMRAVRQLHESQALQFTVPQFRALLYVQRHEGASLSDIAEFLGLSNPSASKIVDHLVRQQFILRENDQQDRRRVLLKVTRRGNSLLRGAHRALRERLAEVLNGLSASELATLHDTLGLLQRSFPEIPMEVPPRNESSTSSRQL